MLTDYVYHKESAALEIQNNNDNCKAKKKIQKIQCVNGIIKIEKNCFK